MNFRARNDLYRHVLLPPVRFATRNDAEVAHVAFNTAMRALSTRVHLRRTLLGNGPITYELLTQTLMDGLVFPNCFGTAAGMDKNADLYPSLFALFGVGHIEAGAVTPLAQPGNPRPRLFRVNPDNLINAMGFPNIGVKAVIENLARLEEPLAPLGMQLGLNKNTDEDAAAVTFAELTRSLLAIRAMRKSRNLPDYFSLNISSPNTPGLRALQDPERLSEILTAICEVLDEYAEWTAHPRRRLILKIAPDMEFAQLERIIELVLQFDLGGVALTNTTVERPIASRFSVKPGGFSGSALYDKSARMVRFAARLLPEDRTLIAVGGIDTADRAYEMLQYAQLIQGYTGLVLKGPYLFRVIAEDVVRRMEAEGVRSLKELRSQNRPKEVIT